MRYYVTLDPTADGKPSVVDVVEHSDGRIEATVDGRALELDVVTIGRQLSLRIGGRILDVTSYGKPPEIGLVARGLRHVVRVESARSRGRDRAKGLAPHGDRALEIKSPMPGRVVRVLVAPGDRIQPGQGLIVLEAMKMENEVRSTMAATVTEVLVSAGVTVDAHARLVTLAAIDP